MFKNNTLEIRKICQRILPRRLKKAVSMKIGMRSYRKEGKHINQWEAKRTKNSLLTGMSAGW